MNFFSKIIGYGVLPIAALGAGCGGEEIMPPPNPPTNTMAIVSGDGQSSPVGQATANPLVVSVTAGGTAVSGVQVSWSVTGGGGSVNPTTSTTGANGQASTTLTLGATAGANTVTASVTGATGSPVAFTATGTGAPPQTASVSVGDNFFSGASHELFQ